MSFPPRVLSLIPPMTQLNTPYPSTAYLTGFLRSRHIDAHQVDLALALVLELFSPAGLAPYRVLVFTNTNNQIFDTEAQRVGLGTGGPIR